MYIKQGRSPSGFWSGSRSGCNANHHPPSPSPTHNIRSQLKNGTSQSTSCTSVRIQMVLKNFLQVYRVLYCRSALHMVGVGNQASSSSCKNTLRTILVLRSKLFYWFPGIREPPLATRLSNFIVLFCVHQTS